MPPSPAPAPQPAAPAVPQGIVSTALRPWLEVAIQPLRCTVTDDSVTIEFELDLFNSGSVPARQVHVAATVIGAGEEQDRRLASFFERPADPGERIATIDPLKHVTFTTQVVSARDQLRPIELGGRQVLVPVIAFNALYGWGGKEGRTSVSYLVGRDGKGEKLSPFRLDLGPRIFRGLGVRPLPTGVRN